MKKSINLEEWEIFKFGEICKFVRGPFGGSLKKSIFKESGFAVYEQKHAIYDRFDNVRYFVDEEKFNEMKRFELNSGDLIMSCSGTIGKIAIVPDNIQRGIINQALLILSPNKKVSNIYLKLWLQSENFQDSLKKYTKGAAIKNVASVKILKNIEISLPPLHQQKQIVAVLDKAFAAIDTAKVNAEQNLQNAKELFASYLQNVFENKGDDWEEVALGKLCELTRGHNPPKSKFIDEPKENYVRFYQIRDGWSDKYMVYVPDTTKLHKVVPTDMLMVAYRHIGRVFRGVTGAFNVALCKISNTSRDRLDDDFLFYMIPTDIIKGELMKRSERSLIPSMSVNHLKEIVIPLPPITEQEEIVQKLDALLSETKKIEAIYTQKIADLEEMKKSVLQKAFSGQLNTIK